MKPFFYNIDILGVCNLACPTCPQSGKNLLPRKLMSPLELSDILDKAQRETIVTGVGLFNWTEPLLHPKCHLMVREVVMRGLPCHLSTNLNDTRNLEKVLDENPTSIRISLSGWGGSTYAATHSGGDFETVMSNLRGLVYLLHYTPATTKIEVLWHRYRHNSNQEPMAREWCKWMGFSFKPCEAYLMPVERVMAVWNGEPQPEIAGHLITPLLNAKYLCSKLTSESCRLQDREIAIDCAGDVHLCCALYDPAKSRIGRYLDLSIGDIQRAKYQSATCTNCMACGGHAYATFLYKPLEKWKNRLGNLRAQLRAI